MELASRRGPHGHHALLLGIAATAACLQIVALHLVCASPSGVRGLMLLPALVTCAMAVWSARRNRVPPPVRCQTVTSPPLVRS